MTLRIDLNCDLGEGGSADEELLSLVTSASIACGFHAGDPTTMRRTVALAARAGVAVGAHPGLPDREGFGRRPMALRPDEVHDLVLYQLGALAAFTRAEGVPLVHVKPHGALYAMTAADPELARAVARAARCFDPGLIVVGLAGGHLLREAHALDLRAAAEAFVDRAYEPDGTLVPRGVPGAVIEDPAVAAVRAAHLVQAGRVAARDGSDLAIHADTLCLHGDGPRPAAFARGLRAALARAGVEVRALLDGGC